MVSGGLESKHDLDGTSEDKPQAGTSRRPDLWRYGEIHRDATRNKRTSVCSRFQPDQEFSSKLDSRMPTCRCSRFAVSRFAADGDPEISAGPGCLKPSS